MNNEEIKIKKEEFTDLINQVNELLKDEYLIKFVEATTVTEDNSNLYQTAEILSPRSSEEWFRFVKFLWMSEKPFRYGIALYERII